MARLRGKAADALNEAREWIKASEDEIVELESMLVKARMQLEMHQVVYNVLEKTLTRKPRQQSTKSSKKPASKSSNKKRAGLPRAQEPTPDICAYVLPDTNHCMEAKDNPIHDQTMGYRDYHPFVAPSSAGSARNTRRGAACSQCGTFVGDGSHTDDSREDYHPFVMSVLADDAQYQSSVNNGLKGKGDTKATPAGAGIQTANIGPLP